LGISEVGLQVLKELNHEVDHASNKENPENFPLHPGKASFLERPDVIDKS
jgi:hypothetical protein